MTGVGGQRARWRHIGLALCVVLAGCASDQKQQSSCRLGNDATRVLGGDTCLVIKTFTSAAAEDHPVLFVVVHGDSSRSGPAVFHYPVAKKLASNGPRGSIAIAMIRPGYEDDRGQVSEGSSNGHRDNYTPTNIEIMAAAIDALKTRYAASRVVGVGHSGGAATLGVIAGKYPNLLDGVVLVSCPCDVPAWRAVIGRPWPSSLSPSSFVSAVPTNTHIVLVSGAADTNTKPYLARDYAQALTSRGVDATVVLVPGADHNSALLTSNVIDAATRLATQ